MRFAAVAFVLLALAPAVHAADYCGKYGLCAPPVTNACGVGYHVATVSLPVNGGCDADVTLYACAVEYFGGSGSVWGNFVWSCEPVASLP